MLKRSSVALMALALAAAGCSEDSKSKDKADDGEDCVGDACEGTGDGDTGDGDNGDGDTGDGDGDGDGSGPVCEGDSDVDGDGVPDCADVCPGADDSKDADKDGTPDACDLCDGESGPRMLLWDGEGELSTNRHAEKGIASVGCSFERTNAGAFVDDLMGGKYQVLVVDLPGALPETVHAALGALAPVVQGFVNQGGGLIFSGASEAWPSGIVDIFAAESTTELEAPATFTVDAALNAPFDLSQVKFAPTSETAAKQGLKIVSVPLSVAYGSTEAGVTTIARGMAGRAFGNAFTLDAYAGNSDGDKLLDVETLIGNQLVAITRAFKNEFYALPWDFYAWEASHAEVLARSVTYRAQPTQWDQAPRVRVLTECVDMEDETDDEVTPGGPYLGEGNAIVAALKHGGIPEADIKLVADHEALAAELGASEVWLVPEHEDCTPDVSLYSPLLLQHIQRGGRLVFGGYTQYFLNDFGAFGSFFQDGYTGESVTLSADPFWGDIQTVTSADATSGWYWEGEEPPAGLEPLASDDDYENTYWLFRALYQVQPWQI